MGEVTTLQIAGLFIGEPEKTVSRPLDQLVLEHDGIVADRHKRFVKNAGVRESPLPKGISCRNNRSFSAVSQEELAEVARMMGIPEIRPEWLGANISFAGCDFLTQLPPRTLLVFEGGVVLQVYGENRPCIDPGKVIQEQYAEKLGLAAQFVEHAWGKKARQSGELRRGRRGIVGWVECEGMLRLGESAEIVLPEYYQDLSALLQSSDPIQLPALLGGTKLRPA